MEPSPADLALIDQYLDPMATPDIRAAVEARMQAEPEFAEWVQLQKTVSSGVRAKALKEKMQHWFVDTQEQPENKTRASSRRWYYAAAVLILLLSGIAYFIKPADTEQLLAVHFEPFPNILLRRAQSFDAVLDQAMVSYSQQAYTEALTQFQQILDKKPEHTDALFYAGVSHLALEQGEAAIPKFQQVLNQGDIRYLFSSGWYLGLALLQNGQKREAIRQFKAVRDSGNSYADKAKAILDELE